MRVGTFKLHLVHYIMCSPVRHLVISVFRFALQFSFWPLPNRLPSSTEVRCLVNTTVCAGCGTAYPKAGE